MICNGIEDLIGDTPLLRIDPSVHGLARHDVYAKLEYMNPFGSVKDRVALSMLRPELEEAKAKGKTVVESTSGNTGKALAALCGVHGLTFRTLTNRIKVPEIRMILETLDAEIEEFPGFSECSDPMDPNDPKRIASDLAKREPERFLYTDQYASELNLRAHYEGTGTEIARDLPRVDAFIGVLGTCGSTLGASRKLKERDADMRLIGVASEAGSWVPGGRNANELWEVGFFRRDAYDRIVSGSKDDAVDGMLTLNRRCGMLCGPTTGLTFTVGMRALRELEREEQDGPRRTAVFIACDRMEPYMSYLRQHRPALFSDAARSFESPLALDEAACEGAEAVSPEALEAALSSKPLVVDVRSSFAFAAGRVPDSMNALDELFARMLEQGDSMPKDRRIVVVCGDGSTSRKFAAYLARQGCNAAYLQGGFGAWRRERKPIARSLSIAAV